MKNTVLLVVDVQKALVDEKPYDIDIVIKNIKKLLDACREKGMQVVYIQHDGKEGSVVEPFSKGWEIHEAIAPNHGEPVMRKKYNSAFKNTGLQEYLDNNSIESIILVGMQTEYCIDTTCRVAFEKGYKLIMPEKTNTTFDNGILTGKQIYEYHNIKIFNNRFSDVKSMDSILELISGNN